MLKLYSKQIKTLTANSISEPLVVRLSSNHLLPIGLRRNDFFLITQSNIDKVPSGFKGYFIPEDLSLTLGEDFLADNVFTIPNDQEYLGDGDVIWFDPNSLNSRTIYRKNSKHNSLLVTERCNNYCLMCSQPPREVNDSYIVEHILQAIPLMSHETNELGITGGEPTLLGEDLIKIIKASKIYLPETSLHMLSNGRNFADLEFAKKVASVAHPDFMIGIPLYSDINLIHDYVVQANGAFDETIRGILNLKSLNQLVELRVVIHKQTYARLPQLAEFITRNLLFIDHVALMGLEMTGFTRTNLDDLWIDPIEYQKELTEAVKIFARFKMNISVYNHQLCLINEEVKPFYRKSISDWKNEYMSECEPCSKKDECGGFFSSAKFKYSEHITPFK
jgi:His-Xaa-Ser system radical SAM maturase HxsC